MFIESRFLRYFDWITFLLTIVIGCIGLLFVYSATFKPELPYSLYLKKQVIGLSVGILLYCLCSLIDYRMLMAWGYVLYAGVIALLLFTIIKGSIGMGAQRWINLGFFKAQPSELAKLFFPLCAIHYIYNHKESFTFTVQQFAPMLIILTLSFVLILKQPDLGTALVILLAGLLLLWLSGLSKQFFLWSAVFLIITAPLSWHMLKPYQKKRVLVFLGQGESNKERYHIEQSKIAIGSGGLLGKGFLKGTQNKLMFLPESRTDFIFSVICEEIGFLGALAIILLYTLFFVRILLITLWISHPLIKLLAFGFTIHIVISCFINIGMVTGLLPIVGIPLPLISYGISNLWITCASLGWFNNIVMQHYQIP